MVIPIIENIIKYHKYNPLESGLDIQVDSPTKLEK